MVDEQTAGSRKTLRLAVKALNRGGARLRTGMNPAYGRQKTVGGVDDAPFLVTGTDSFGRRVSIKGTGEFITRQLMPKTKEPWEMTREEYAAKAKRDETKRVSRFIGNVEAGRRLAETEKEIAAGKLGLTTKEGKRSQWGEFVDHWRKQVIKQALSEGKPVPVEVLKDYPNLAKKTVKEPWKMTKGEYAAASRPPLKIKKLSKGSDTEFDRSRRLLNAKNKAFLRKEWERQGLSKAEITERFRRNKAFDLHRQHVERALSEGKPIPVEVLKDYPDLDKATKEPWEMTREEYLNKTDGFPELPSRVKLFVRGSMAGFDEMVGKWHAHYVAKAFFKGKPVPSKVLKDYPDPDGMVE